MAESPGCPPRARSETTLVPGPPSIPSHSVAIRARRHSRAGPPQCPWQAIGAARRYARSRGTAAPSCVDRNSPLVAAALHECRSGTASDRAAGACSSSRAGVNGVRAETPASVEGGASRFAAPRVGRCSDSSDSAASGRSQAVSQDFPFAEKRESPPARLVVVPLRSSDARLARRSQHEQSGLRERGNSRSPPRYGHPHSERRRAPESPERDGLHPALVQSQGTPGVRLTVPFRT